MRQTGLIIFLIFILVIAAVYPSKFTVVEYFENKKDASGNPVPKVTKTTTKTKSSGSTPKTPSKEPSKEPSKDKKDTSDKKHIGSGSSSSNSNHLEPASSSDSYQPYPYSGTQSEKFTPNTLNKDKKEQTIDTHKTKIIKQGITNPKPKTPEMGDEWILKSTLIPCSCPTTTCGHNLEQNSEDNDFALLNQGVEKGTNIGPFSRPLIADVQLPNSALNKEWVRTNLMQYQPPKPFLSDFQSFTY